MTKFKYLAYLGMFLYIWFEISNWILSFVEQYSSVELRKILQIYVKRGCNELKWRNLNEKEKINFQN